VLLIKKMKQTMWIFTTWH